MPIPQNLIGRTYLFEQANLHHRITFTTETLAQIWMISAFQKTTVQRNVFYRIKYDRLWLSTTETNTGSWLSILDLSYGFDVTMWIQITNITKEFGWTFGDYSSVINW